MPQQIRQTTRRARPGASPPVRSAGKTFPEPPATRRSTPSGGGNTLNIAGRQIHLSNLQKVLYPSSGFTKGQVIDYYARIAPTILPYLQGRPLTLKRYPDGVNAAFFYEKMCPSHRPDWVTTARLPSTGGKRAYIDYCVIDDTATLLWVANLASLELHTLLGTAAHPLRPDFMVFDLDPGPGTTLLDCARIALRFHGLLKDLHLQSLPRTSGGKGLHLCIPLNTPVTFEQTKTLSRAMAQVLERDDPSHITSNMRKDLRPGKVFVDWSQNDHHKTTVTTYSLRAREQPTACTPLSWDELTQAIRHNDANRLVFQSDQTLRRVDKQGDLFAPLLTLHQSLPSL